jgi:polysaccharide export outer membrane protein
MGERVLAYEHPIVAACAATRKSASVLITLLALTCAGTLAGCGGSFNNEFELMQQEQKPASGLASTPGVGAEGKAVRLPRAADGLTSAGTPGSTAYKIGPADVLDVSVFKVPELARSVLVDDAGAINLPLLGDVPAAGKTARQLERELAAKLGAKYLQKPQVTVSVKEYNNQRVTVEGAVKTPGVHSLKGKTSLMQLIAMSGGLDTAATDWTVVVFRQTDGKRYAAKFDFEAIRKGQAEDPAILPGDVVVANSSAIKAAWGDFLKALPVASFALLLL